MIIKSNDGFQRTFQGVTFDVLAVGPLSMVTRMNYKDGDYVPMHRHPNEQAGYVLSGRYHLCLATGSADIQAGDSYDIPANVDHSMDVLEPGQVIDVFTPPREDYF